MNLFVILGVAGIVLLSSQQLAFAERGQNYDITQTGPNEFLWTSHYDRIWNGNSWVNYILTETSDSLIFESSNMNYKFNKNSCEFSLFNPITKETAIELFSHDLTINGIKVTLSACEIVNINPTNDWLYFKVLRTTSGGELATIYQINAIGEMEWTHEIKNTDLFQVATFGVDETCLNCEPIKTDGDILFFNDYYLDTKNIVHNTLKSISSDTKDVNFVYESEPINFFQPVIIDPVFGYSSGTFKRVHATIQTGTACGATTAIDSTTNQLEKPNSAAGDSCKIVAWRWDISSLPNTNIDVTDTKIRYDVVSNAGTPINCDFNDIQTTHDPNTSSDITMWNDITNSANGTTYVNNDSGCTTVSNDKILDLGPAADSFVESSLLVDFFAIGVPYDNMVRDGAGHDIVFGNPELEITYTRLATGSVSVTVTNVGDEAKITGLTTVTSLTTDITQSKFMVNGTTFNTNNTLHVGTTPPYSVNLGPFWYRMATNSVYNFTIQSTLATPDQSITNKSSVLITREYTPQYFTAVVPSQGKYNYTFNDGLFKINRNTTGVLNQTYQIECFFQNWALVAFNSTTGDWFNETNKGYFLFQEPDINPNFNYLVSCYNEDLIFSDTVYSDGPLALLGIGALDATYSSYIGVPIGVLFIVMAASLASQRNAPIWIVIVLAIAGVMATIGFFSIDPLVWALALIAGLLGLFVGRKLF